MKFQKVFLASALVFTSIIGTSVIDTPKVEASSITAQGTSAHAIKGVGDRSSNINGAGQYGRVTLVLNDPRGGAFVTVKKVVSWGSDKEVATYKITNDDILNYNTVVTGNVWLEKGELYYIEVSVRNDASASASFTNYNY
ncbi:hypothetical protein CN907_14465 [Bacillus anthracis]|nr:hypothetical protein CN907_14465 [Bacillus anthracis]